MRQDIFVNQAEEPCLSQYSNPYEAGMMYALFCQEKVTSVQALLDRFAEPYRRLLTGFRARNPEKDSKEELMKTLSNLYNIDDSPSKNAKGDVHTTRSQAFVVFKRESDTLTFEQTLKRVTSYETGLWPLDATSEEEAVDLFLEMSLLII